jgi:hypothetical protein
MNHLHFMSHDGKLMKTWLTVEEDDIVIMQVTIHNIPDL